MCVFQKPCRCKNSRSHKTADFTLGIKTHRERRFTVQWRFLAKVHERNFHKTGDIIRRLAGSFFWKKLPRKVFVEFSTFVNWLWRRNDLHFHSESIDSVNFQINYTKTVLHNLLANPIQLEGDRRDSVYHSANLVLGRQYRREIWLKVSTFWTGAKKGTLSLSSWIKRFKEYSYQWPKNNFSQPASAPNSTQKWLAPGCSWIHLSNEQKILYRTLSFHTLQTHAFKKFSIADSGCVEVLQKFRRATLSFFSG